VQNDNFSVQSALPTH